MKRLIPLAVVALTALLAGCRSDVAELKFGTSVVADRVDYNTGSRIKPVYREGIIRLLTDAGIDPDKVRIGFDEDDYSNRTMLLTAPLFEGLSSPQKETLRQALNDILDARNTDFYLNLTLHRDAINTDDARLKEDSGTLEAAYRTQLTIDDAIIGLSYNLGSFYAAAFRGSRESEGDAYCSVAMNMSLALPFSDVELAEAETPADGTAEAAAQTTVLVRNAKGRAGRYSIPVEVAVTLAGQTPALQAKLDQHEVMLSTVFINSKSIELYRKEIRALEFLVGPIREVQHEYGRVSYLTLLNLKEQCRAMAAETMGRPFSFSMGESIDRLESVTVF